MLEIVIRFLCCTIGCGIGAAIGAALSKGNGVLTNIGLVAGFMVGLLILRSFERGRLMQNINRLTEMAEQKKYQKINFQ